MMHHCRLNAVELWILDLHGNIVSRSELVYALKENSEKMNVIKRAVDTMFRKCGHQLHAAMALTILLLGAHLNVMNVLGLNV